MITVWRARTHKPRYCIIHPYRVKPSQGGNTPEPWPPEAAAASGGDWRNFIGGSVPSATTWTWPAATAASATVVVAAATTTMVMMGWRWLLHLLSIA